MNIFVNCVPALSDPSKSLNAFLLIFPLLLGKKTMYSMRYWLVTCTSPEKVHFTLSHSEKCVQLSSIFHPVISPPCTPIHSRAFMFPCFIRVRKAWRTSFWKLVLASGSPVLLLYCFDWCARVLDHFFNNSNTCSGCDLLISWRWLATLRLTYVVGSQ